MRELAAELGVNPNTVAAAYRILRERGVIETAGRRGSRVRAKPATTGREFIRVDVPAGVRDAVRRQPGHGAAAAAGAGVRLGGRPAATGSRCCTDTRRWNPSWPRWPGPIWTRTACRPGRSAVASGSLDAIERVLAAHLRPGDAVAVEDPGWGALLDLVPALGLRAVPVGLDDEGPLPEDVRACAGGRGARAGRHRPGAEPDRRRGERRARAAAARRARGASARSCSSRTTTVTASSTCRCIPSPGVTRHWAFVRSVAKAYGPDLRLAVLTGDAVTVDRVSGRQRLGPGLGQPDLLQRAVRAAVGRRRGGPAERWLARTAAGATR